MARLSIGYLKKVALQTPKKPRVNATKIHAHAIPPVHRPPQRSGQTNCWRLPGGYRARAPTNQLCLWVRYGQLVVFCFAQSNMLIRYRESSAYYARLYKDNSLTGAHVIKLGPGNDDAAKEALRAWPGTRIFRDLRINKALAINVLLHLTTYNY